MPDVRMVTVTLNPAIDVVLEVEKLAVGQSLRASRLGWYPGGKGVNVARNLAVLGTRCIATGFVGESELAEFERHVERVGDGRVVMQLLVVRGTTRTNLTIMDPVFDTETHLREEGFKVYPEDVRRISSKVAMLAREETIMMFGGSLPPGVSLGDFRSMLHVCQDQGCRIVVDTSESAYPALRDEPIWMLKLNAAELGSFTRRPTGTEQEVIEVARAVSTLGGGVIQYVIATRGADGAVMVGPDLPENHVLVAKALVHPSRVINTVGCGDALLAGLLHEWGRTGHWEQALRSGVATATANAVSREPGAISLDDVREFLDATLVQPV